MTNEKGSPLKALRPLLFCFKINGEQTMGSRKKKKRNTGRKPSQSPKKRKLPLKWLSLAAVILIAGAVLAVVSFKPASTSSESKNQTAAHTENPDGFQKLVGRWLRPDGGYIVEIRGITEDGRMDAAYLNPRPIHVAQADASWKSGSLQVFIELRDTGYPGSTYTLEYNPKQDVLTGIYYQAAMKQSFEVVFVRAR
jgi:hypothetical protein